ncbi:MAG TPA: sigma-54 dependent transcriptional regulator, partial [Burkholderiales bacterium]|nr:sigma-54 dependent transcriptional regulator [Burkholderiales bacterium]
MRARILLVDGDTTVQAALVNFLSGLGYDAVPAFDGAEAIARLRSGGFNLCLTDVRLPGPDIPLLDGYAVLREARRQTPAVPVVMLTTQATIVDAVNALRAGAANFLPKPFHPSAVEEILQRILADTGRAIPAPHTTEAAVIGEHPAMRAVLERISQVADTDASILIRGETGTGKEVIARLIHASSSRSSGPFVAVNMAAIPESLADSELFGHVRGAFTGADKPRVGRFLSAHQGTLFFDEIGEMPRNLQAKLLRVLQDREVTPVGSSEQIPADVRVIA